MNVQWGRRATWVVCGIVAAGLGCTETEHRPICAADELRDALARATPGTTVAVGDCAVSGNFLVPVGVTLQGQGSTSILAGGGTEPVLRVTAGEGLVTSVLDLAVVSDGRAGIIVEGVGAAEIARVGIEARRGVGLAGKQMTHLVLSDSTIDGPVTAANVDGVAADPTLDDTATHGLVLTGVADATLARVDVNGFAAFGGVIVDSVLSWRGGDVDHNLGTGLMVSGGDATLEDLTISHTFRGFRLIPAYGLVAADGASVSTEGLVLLDNEEYGVLQDSSEVRHLNVQGSGNGAPAVWVQHSSYAEITGPNSLIENNRLAGVVAIESSNLTVTDATISGTISETMAYETRQVMVGDGIHLVDTATSVRLADLTLSANARVGLLLDSGDAPFAGVDIANLRVDGSGTQLGAIAQGTAVPADWDANIIRGAIIEANDGAFAGVLDTVEIVGPNSRPRTDAAGLPAGGP